MIDPEFLEESDKQRMRLLRRLECRDADEVEYILNILVQRCLNAVKEACCNAPEPTRYKTSNNSSHIKIPSDRMKDIEQELGELDSWFRSGRRPRLRTQISTWTIAAMVGLPPFGKHYIAVTTHKVTAEERRAPLETRIVNLEHKNLHLFDILSSNDAIMQCQIELYSTLRTTADIQLYLEIGDIDVYWPTSFTNFVDLHLETGRESFGLKDLEAVLSYDDFTRMGYELTGTQALFRRLRREYDQRSKATVATWAGCEPGFALIKGMLNHVWPVIRGQPTGKPKGRSRAVQSQQQDLEDLAGNLSALVQEILNSKEALDKPKFERVRSPNHFLGDKGDDAAVGICSLILRLRKEQIAYTIARDTLDAICDAVFYHANEMLNSEANKVCSKITTPIGHRLTARKVFLGYGADRMEGSAFKWCGQLDPYKLKHWPGTDKLAATAFPNPNRDQTYHLELYTDLVRSLVVDDEAMHAWWRIAAWAGGEGRESWKVVIPEFDRM